jgi:hypothetical protein
VSLLTPERYAVLTGDSTTAASAVSARAEDAEKLLVEHLGRPVALQAYTETLELYPSGAAFPNVTPVTVPPEGIVYRLGAFEGCPVDGGPFPDYSPPPTTTVTYTAGWDETTVPMSVELDLAWAVWALLNPTTPPPAGAKTIANGDASITYDGVSGGGNHVIGWSTSTSAYRARRI